MEKIEEIIKENERRRAQQVADYEPLSGKGCLGERFFHKGMWLPESMRHDAAWRDGLTGNALERLRVSHDFEFWAARCVVIRDKISGCNIEFVLNRPQRRVLEVLERQRHAGEPLRMILLKARQWGGSTLVQIYMAWIQLVHKRNWHSITCAHVKDAAATIRDMFTRLLASYPEELWEGDEAPALKAFEGAQNTRRIAGRGCTLTLGTSENPDSARGRDIAMAHLSEVAFWRDSLCRQPGEMVRAIVGGIALTPLSMVVLESTANGVGSYFHREWMRAEAGESDKTAVFVPWHEIEIYRLEVKDARAVWERMDGYERALWDERGLTLEQIAWYQAKRREFPSHSRMMAEYPTTAGEAFRNSGAGVFAAEWLERLAAECREPQLTGDVAGRRVTGSAALEDVRLTEAHDGELSVWERPVAGADYVVTVDVGGRSATSDWSVISVLRRGERPAVVACWRGHIDHDLLAWKSAGIAQFYNEALLVIESNTLETESSGEPSVILDTLRRTYSNLYMRHSGADATGQGGVLRPGFHTNVCTKAAVIAHLVAAVRDGAYQERDRRAVDEMTTYEQLPSGAYAARPGEHDDVLMTRAIGLYVMSQTHEARVGPGLPRVATGLWW